MEILGETFLDNQGAQKNADIFFHAEKFIGIYFSANWASACQEFDPMLVDFYNKVNKTRKKIEIVYVTSDEDPNQFNSQLSSFPWVSIPFNDTRVMELKGMYAISAVPVLVIIRKDGTVVTTNGRNDIYAMEDEAIDHWI